VHTCCWAQVSLRVWMPGPIPQWQVPHGALGGQLPWSHCHCPQSACPPGQPGPVLKGGGGVLLLLQAKCPHCMTSCDTKMSGSVSSWSPKGPNPCTKLCGGHWTGVPCSPAASGTQALPCQTDTSGPGVRGIIVWGCAPSLLGSAFQRRLISKQVQETVLISAVSPRGSMC